MGHIEASPRLPVCAGEASGTSSATPAATTQWLTMHEKWKDEVPADARRGRASSTQVVTMLDMANTIAWTVEEFEEPPKLTSCPAPGWPGVKTAFTSTIAPTATAARRSRSSADFEGAADRRRARARPWRRTAQTNLDLSLAKLDALLGRAMTATSRRAQFNVDDTALDSGPTESRSRSTRERLAQYAAATNDPIAAHRAGDVAPPVFADRAGVRVAARARRVAVVPLSWRSARSCTASRTSASTVRSVPATCSSRAAR